MFILHAPFEVKRAVALPGTSGCHRECPPRWIPVLPIRASGQAARHPRSPPDVPRGPEPIESRQPGTGVQRGRRQRRARRRACGQAPSSRAATGGIEHESTCQWPVRSRGGAWGLPLGASHPHPSPGGTGIIRESLPALSALVTHLLAEFPVLVLAHLLAALLDHAAHPSLLMPIRSPRSRQGHPAARTLPREPLACQGTASTRSTPGTCSRRVCSMPSFSV